MVKEKEIKSIADKIVKNHNPKNHSFWVFCLG